MNSIDLHNHSKYSIDGEYSSKDLVDLALKKGIKYLSISDHDDIRAIKDALDYSKNKDITIIPGIEISSSINGIGLHILGYGIDYTSQEFIDRMNFVKESNIGYGKKLLNKAHEYGFFFNDEEVYKLRDDGLICEEMLGEVILNDSRNDNNEELKEFRNNGIYSDNPAFNFYKVLTTIGKPLYVEYDFNLDIKETEKLIHNNGGKMFLAHPGHNIKKDESILKEIINYGLDGIEVFSSYHDKETIEFYYSKAKEYNLYMSVGSDFHGHSKPSIKMGSIDYDKNELNKTIKFIRG